MCSDRLPYSCYQVLLKYNNAGKTNWATAIKNILCNYGFFHVWVQQGVGDKHLFLKILAQRIKDCYLQDWSNMLSQSSKLADYCNYKSLIEPEKYLSWVQFFRHKRALTKLRCCSHDLAIEIGRRQNVPREERFCKYCLSKWLRYVEDEYHLVVKCELYGDIRSKYLPSNILKNYDCKNEYYALMSNQNSLILSNLAIFVYQAFINRNHYFAEHQLET